MKEYLSGWFTLAVVCFCMVSYIFYMFFLCVIGKSEDMNSMFY